MAHNLARSIAASLLLALAVPACGDGTQQAPSAAGSGEAAAVVDELTNDTLGFFDASFVHEISVSFDEREYDEMVDTYAATGEKEWIEATVTIDGTTFERVGMRLKGNSSLFGLRGDAGGPAGPASDASADAPESLPWLIRLDEYVDGQSYEGIFDLVVRSNTSQTSLNEAVALDLLELAGLASQDAVASSFSVNGSDAELRLVIEHPDDVWMAENFEDPGALYKAESTGDYSYRGTDPGAYDEVFDQEAGKDVTDLTPLVEFLDFINNADDETFYAELSDRLDVEAFATYLAVQELIGNFDDIDGPGNNSYLYYDAETGVVTVVPWDHNLAFGAIDGGGAFDGGDLAPGGGFRGGPPGGIGGAGIAPPGRGDGDVELQPLDGGAGALPGDPGRPGRDGGSNVLVERFMASDELSGPYEERLAELEAQWYEGGVADGILADWVDVLEMSDLVDAATIEQDASRVSAYFGADGAAAATVDAGAKGPGI
jgi:spore coat protein CotH